MEKDILKRRSFEINWERKALERIVILLLEDDIAHTKLVEQLNSLSIEYEKDSTGYMILSEIAEEWDMLVECITAVEKGNVFKQDFVKWCLEATEEKYRTC